MRVYDVALVIVRATAAIELIHAVVELGYTGVRFTFLIGAVQGSAWLNRVELSTWLLPVQMVVFGLALLMFSKPLARFAAKFAAHTDTAGQF